jgi:diguanylate cyclase (GGDEF)-like protein
MGSHSPTMAAIQWTQRFVLGAVGEDVARTRRSSCLILLAVFVPLGVLASVAFRPNDFAAPPSVAGVALTVSIFSIALTTRHESQQHRWGAVVVLIALAQAIGIYQLGPYGMVLLPETSMLGAWAALYLPTRVVRLSVVCICIAITVTLVQADERLVALIAVIVAQITIASLTLLVHTAVLTLRATNDELDDARRLAHKLATTDALTGAANRRSFTDVVAALRTNSAAEDWPASHSLVLVDIDRFKDLNDRHGHLVGDEVLREVAHRLSRALPTASVARWGGEEFAVLRTDTDPGHSPAEAAESLRSTVERHPIATSGGSLECTISAGATAWDGAEPFEDALRRADGALYEAKAGGRNRSVERPPGSVGADDLRRPA